MNNMSAMHDQTWRSDQVLSLATFNCDFDRITRRDLPTRVHGQGKLRIGHVTSDCNYD
jgi:hypothetical protein